MSLMDEVQLLRAIPLFSGVPPAKLKLLAFASDRVSFKPGETVFRCGDSGDAAYVVLSGEAEVFQTEGDTLVKVGDATANALVGEISVLTELPCNVTVKARTALETLKITKDQLQNLMTCCPYSMSEIMRSIGRRLSLVN